MKRYVCLLISLSFLSFCLCGCNQTVQTKETKAKPAETSTEEPSGEEPTDSEYYELDDFSDIVIDKSTLEDVWKIIPPPESASFGPTSYGSSIIYPAKNNAKIVVAFNDDRIVIDIFQLKGENNDSFSDFLENPWEAIQDLYEVFKLLIEEDGYSATSP